MYYLSEDAPRELRTHHSLERVLNVHDCGRRKHSVNARGSGLTRIQAKLEIRLNKLT